MSAYFTYYSGSWDKWGVTDKPSTLFGFLSSGNAKSNSGRFGYSSGVNTDSMKGGFGRCQRGSGDCYSPFDDSCNYWPRFLLGSFFLYQSVISTTSTDQLDIGSIRSMESRSPLKAILATGPWPMIPMTPWWSWNTVYLDTTLNMSYFTGFKTILTTNR